MRFFLLIFCCGPLALLRSVGLQKRTHCHGFDAASQLLLGRCVAANGWSAEWDIKRDGWIAHSLEDELSRLLLTCWLPLLINVVDDVVLLNNISITQGKVRSIEFRC